MAKYSPHRNIVIAVQHYFGDKCIYCGGTKILHLHHIIPLRMGGLNELGNMELVCQKCHMKLHKRLREIFPVDKIQKYEITCSKCGKLYYRKIKIKGDICLKCRAYQAYRDNKLKIIK